MVVVFPQIFLDLHSSHKFIMHVQWSFLEDHFGQKEMHLVCAWLIRGEIPPQTTSLTLSICDILKNSKLNALITVYLSSNHPTFSVRAQGPICNLGPYLYIYYINYSIKISSMC